MKATKKTLTSLVVLIGAISYAHAESLDESDYQEKSKRSKVISSNSVQKANDDIESKVHVYGGFEGSVTYRRRSMMDLGADNAIGGTGNNADSNPGLKDTDKLKNDILVHRAFVGVDVKLSEDLTWTAEADLAQLHEFYIRKAGENVSPDTHEFARFIHKLTFKYEGDAVIVEVGKQNLLKLPRMKDGTFGQSGFYYSPQKNIEGQQQVIAGVIEADISHALGRLATAGVMLKAAAYDTTSYDLKADDFAINFQVLVPLKNDITLYAALDSAKDGSDADNDRDNSWAIGTELTVADGVVIGGRFALDAEDNEYVKFSGEIAVTSRIIVGGSFSRMESDSKANGAIDSDALGLSLSYKVDEQSRITGQWRTEEIETKGVNGKQEDEKLVLTWETKF